MKNLKTMILIIAFSIMIAGCSSTDEVTSKQEEQLEIYTTIYPIQYAVERIGGDTVSVETVYPPGVDAHSYEPTTKDMTSLADSTAFIYMGAGMEGFAESAADALASQDVSLIEIGAHDELFHSDSETDVEEEHAHNDHDSDTEEAHDHNDHESDAEEAHDYNNHESDAEEAHDHNDHDSDAEEEHEESEETDSHDGHNHGDHDPHIWIDPLRMIEMAEIIKNELITLNPEDEALYNDNFAALEADLYELDEKYKEVLEAKVDKHVLVSHAAFGYWEERYGIEQIAISGLSTSSEPSQKELTNIIDISREYGLEHIIFEQNTSSRVSEIIQNEIGAESLMIHNLSVLTNEDVDNNEDYLSLMNYNLDILDKATK
ncbi:metal ABC transporter solute-binding protein, Zn/Mn family [Oceanobacillus damuensis]|uniref:metal ABC transporter solute-binding protein, Zn/Mn family n=1 Tax=Oceanobacillus damuensis TaxID=937928 RepID=UPI000832DAED|nr:zinc ABC transporter substrate-binding protein [Oceanobacillus damuensis]